MFDAVKSGALDGAASPASVLQSICEKLQLAPEVAADVNKESYRTKMESCMEKKSLTDEDVEAGGSFTTSTRPTPCSDDPSPCVCTSSLPEGKSCVLARPISRLEWLV